MGEDDWIWLKRWLKFHVKLLGRHFHILRWTECSASCEGGTQSRLFGFPDSLGLVARSKTWSHHCLFCNIFVDAQRDPALQDAAGMWICAFILFWSVSFCKKLKVSRLPRARNRDTLSIWAILEIWDDSVWFALWFLLWFLSHACAYSAFQVCHSIEASSGHLCRAWRGVVSLRSLEILRPSQSRLISDMSDFSVHVSACHPYISLPHLKATAF